MIGYAFIGCGAEVKYHRGENDPIAIYACFGQGITGYKDFSEYAGMTLTDWFFRKKQQEDFAGKPLVFLLYVLYVFECNFSQQNRICFAA